MPEPTDDLNLELDDSTSPSDENLSTPEGEDSPEGNSKRTAESRINQLVAKNKQLEKELQDKEELGRTTTQTLPPPPPPSSGTPITPEAQRIVEQLKAIGVAFRTDLDTELETVRSRTALDNEHFRLERSFTGEDGRPRYDRSKIEAYMRDNGIYKPEVAYKALYEEELTDWTIRNAESRRTNRPVTERSGSVSGNRPEANAITRERMQEMYAKGPRVYMEWYNKNRSKIMELSSQGKL